MKWRKPKPRCSDVMRHALEDAIAGDGLTLYSFNATGLWIRRDWYELLPPRESGAYELGDVDAARAAGLRLHDSRVIHPLCMARWLVRNANGRLGAHAMRADHGRDPLAIALFISAGSWCQISA